MLYRGSKRKQSHCGALLTVRYITVCIICDPMYVRVYVQVWENGTIKYTCLAFIVLLYNKLVASDIQDVIYIDMMAIRGGRWVGG